MTDERYDYREWLRSFDDYEDHGKAAVQALDDLGRLSQRARSLLLPILTEAFLMERRTTARSVERSVPVGAVFTGETTLEQRTRRLSGMFPVGDGRRVSWLDATVQDHLDRIAYLEQHVAGLQRTIDSHAEAIELIRSHGVSCLGEIGEAA